MSEASQLDRKTQEITGVSIKLASQETVRNWSYGEVTKPETINYRSFKPERDGLFCEKIFGPVRNWECNCGKYKRIRYRGVVCDRCGVEVTHSKVRRERMGHIELAVPIVHIWFLKSVPSHISYLLGIPNTTLERIIYYESYVVIDPGNTSLRKGQLLTEDEYFELMEQNKQFDAQMGGKAVLELLGAIDIEELVYELRSKIKFELSDQRRLEHLKRLRIAEAFNRSKNDPRNMVLQVLPVLPPDLRPLVPLEGGRFATSDLNDLYRRVINRNNRLKKLIEIKAPDVILRNEMRMLQEAVDTLFDNGRRTFSVKGEGKRPLKSLSDLLKGKQGRFRQNLLGKRVDYSGRSVIVVGPELRIHQCGLPKLMALELFKPFVIQKLEEKGLVQTVKSAKKFVEKERPEVWDILEEVIKDHPVLLNRAPTLHRLGIQAFFPVLVEGKAIRLHPLVCSAFNADFDGDQMAVHVPLSFESQLECRFLMLSANNLLSPASGHPVMTPTQDIVLGLYYMTKQSLGRQGEGRAFSGVDEVLHAIAARQVDIHAKIRMRHRGQLIETTPGRVVFNTVVPEEIPFVNDLLNKKRIQKLIQEVYDATGTKVTCNFLDNIKAFGYEYATRAGITFGADDLVIPEEKNEIIDKAQVEVKRIRGQYDRGVITEGERYNKLIDLWTRTTSQIAEKMHERFANDKNGFNPVYIMMDSQARGSKDQIKQLAGMRGLMQKPQKKITGAVGEIIENPIISNFKGGLTVLEYFISTHGARKGLADTALKTADAGYLTRRLVDVVQDVVISENDCGTSKGIKITALSEGDDEIEPLSARLLGRVTLDEVKDPLTEEQICPENTLIDEKLAKEIESKGIESVMIRSVLTCDSDFGVCQHCYGRNLATGKLVDIGEAVGIMAAQSIGEPGTQLTLRTFHIGGTASRLATRDRKMANIKEVEGIAYRVRLKDVEVERHETDHPDTKAKVDDASVVMSRAGQFWFESCNKKKGDDVWEEVSRHPDPREHEVPYASYIWVKDCDEVHRGQMLFSWDPYNKEIIATGAGEVRWIDLEEGVTYKTEKDPGSGATNIVVTESRERSKLQPQVHIYNESGERVANLSIPAGGYLQFRDGQKVRVGDVVAKIPREGAKSRDITGGLPRVAELFEARRPKDPAVVAEIDGIVSFGETERGQRKILVTDEYGGAKEHSIPVGKHLRVHEGDRVRAGDRLCEGAIDPHEVLRINGENEVQKHMLDEIQQVYRLQGVTINDKHVEVIVSQMLRKVRVKKSGGTDFLEGDDIDRKELHKANRKILADGGEPATFEPLLLGITKASLTTESFLSAASFQETTKVLSKAAVEGKVDNLSGLKENLIMGNLIPAGTGLRELRRLKVKDLEETDIVEVAEHESSDDFVELGGEF